jgi:hypothetical protein
MLLPLSVAAVVALHRWLPSGLASAAAMVLGVGTLAYSLVFYPPPRIEGYQAVADYVAAQAPARAVVLFHGERDGNFIYAMRERAKRPDVMIVRTDKLLLRVVAGERLRGVQQTDFTEAQILTMVKEMGVELIVYQPGFWADLRQMERFANVLHTDAFERVATFPITATVPHDDSVIEVFRPTYQVDRTRRDIQIDMPMVGEPFQSELAPR